MKPLQQPQKPPQDQKPPSHYQALERVFKQQCGLSNSLFKTRWAVGKP